MVRPISSLIQLYQWRPCNASGGGDSEVSRTEQRARNRPTHICPTASLKSFHIICVWRWGVGVRGQPVGGSYLVPPCGLQRPNSGCLVGLKW